jgi:hypothetical protein
MLHRHRGHTAQHPFRCVVREAYPAIDGEVGDGVPAPKHIVDGLGKIMVTRLLGELGVQSVVQFGDQGRAQLLTRGKPLRPCLAVDTTLNVEQGVQLLHRLQRDGIDVASPLAAPLLAHSALNVGKFEELRAGMGKASRLQDRSVSTKIVLEPDRSSGGWLLIRAA